MNSRILTLLIAMLVLTTSCNKSSTTPNNSTGGTNSGGNSGGNTGGNTGGNNNSSTPAKQLEFKLDGILYTGNISIVQKNTTGSKTFVTVSGTFTRNGIKHNMTISMQDYKGVAQYTSMSSIHFAKQQPDSVWGGFSPCTININKDSSTYLSGTFLSDMEVYMYNDPQRNTIDTAYLTDGKFTAHW